MIFTESPLREPRVESLANGVEGNLALFCHYEKADYCS